MNFVKMDNDQYQMGKTKVFIKNPESVRTARPARIRSCWLLRMSAAHRLPFAFAAVPVGGDARAKVRLVRARHSESLPQVER